MARIERGKSSFESLLIEEINNEISKRNNVENPAFDIRVAHLAAALHMDASTLRRHCQKHLQISPKDFLDRYRISQAKQRLVSGEKPSQVFSSLGFREHKTFSSLFKRIEGQTPSEYSYEGAIG